MALPSQKMKFQQACWEVNEYDFKYSVWKTWNVFSLFLTKGVRTTATVYYNGGKFSYKVGVLDKSGVAYGAFNDTTDTTGWGVLDVKFGPTSSYQEDLIRMKAAGMLEGILTSQ